MQYSFRPRRRLRLQFTPSQVLVLGFAAVIILGTVLLRMPFAQEPGQELSWVDAFFTATSAVCVTGLVVVDTAVQFSRTGEFLILGMVQVGGLGIMTLSALMMLLMGRRISLRERLLMQEALGSFSIAGVVRLTRNIIFTTMAIEAVGALLLAMRWSREYPWPKALYWGIFHSVTAFNNAGFDVTSASLRPFKHDPFVLLVVALLILLGGLGFFVLEDLWRHRRWESLSLHSRLVLKVSAGLVGLGTLLLLLFEWANPATIGQMPWLHKISNAIFLAVTPRTAGFETIPTGSLLDVTLFAIIVLMFIGASPGGTGGGIKTTTFTMIALTIRATATGKQEVEVMGRRLARDLVDKAVTIVAIAIGILVTVISLLLLSEAGSLADPASGVTFLRIMFEATSAFATVGLSTGITDDFSDAGKLLISVVMFIGRVGPLTMAVALAQRKKDREPIHFPEDRVMIG